MFELQSCHYYEGFSNVFAYYGKSKPKEVKCQRTFILKISYDVILKYTCAKKNTSHCTKKWKYAQEMIEMIF